MAAAAARQMEVGEGGREDAPRRLLEAANDEAGEPRLSCVLFSFTETYIRWADLLPLARGSARLGSAWPSLSRRGACGERKRGRETSSNWAPDWPIAEADKKTPSRLSHRSLPELLKQSLCTSH